jgi:hypothetical protein
MRRPRWWIFCDFSDEARRDLAEHLLSFCFALDDLRTTDDEAIDARELAPLPRLGLTVMKHATSEELIERLVAHADDIRALLATEAGRGGWSRILRYTWYVNPHIDRDVIRLRLVPIMGTEIEQNMLGYGQKLEKQAYDKGLERGLERGLEQGLARGQRALLLRQLERRFGSLPARVTERLERASTDELERWSERILDAASLDDLGL